MCIHQNGRPRHGRWLTLAVVLLLPLGCSEKQRQKMATTVTNQAQKLADKTRDFGSRATSAVKEQLPVAGQVTLQATPAIEPTAEANIEVISIGDGRENVVQIASYDVSSPPTDYPSLLIRGRTKAGDAASLDGETISCELYYRASPTSPIAMTPANESVKIIFGAYNPNSNTVSATMGKVSLIGSDNVPVGINGGSIVALISNGGS